MAKYPLKAVNYYEKHTERVVMVKDVNVFGAVNTRNMKEVIKDRRSFLTSETNNKEIYYLSWKCEKQFRL